MRTSASRPSRRTPSARPRPVGVPHHRRSPLASLARAASWHRRKLAALAAAATVLTVLAALAPAPPPTTPVVRTRVALAGGAVLTADDVEVAELLRSDVPDQALGELDAVVGQRLAAPLPRHQTLTPDALAAGDSVSVGHVLAPVRLSDADVVALLRPGDRVDVIASATEGGATSTVTRAARVVTVPPRTSDDLGTAAGALVLLDVPDGDAAALARAVATGNLTVIWS